MRVDGEVVAGFNQAGILQGVYGKKVQKGFARDRSMIFISGSI